MAKKHQYKAGDIIIKEGNTGESAYILIKGRVKVTKTYGGKESILTYLDAGQIFGEMSMIDDRPRSATITAVEETMVQEIHRDKFCQNLQNDPDMAVKVLKVLFSRLRESNIKILQLQAKIREKESSCIEKSELPEEPTPLEDAQKPEELKEAIFLIGMTPKAEKALPKSPYPITKFPFRLGRSSNDPLSDNDLMLLDVKPFKISRHHVELIDNGRKIGVIDRGSHLGTIVNGKLIGGGGNNPGPVYFKRKKQGRIGTLILGGKNSPYQFEVVK